MSFNGNGGRRKRVVFVICQKGGVGKSTWCRGYLDRLRSAGLKVAAFDADNKVGQLVQYYGTRTDGKLDDVQDPFKGVGYFDVRDERQRDMLVNASEYDADVILVDMPGGSMQELTNVVGDGKTLLQAYRDRGFEVIVVIVINHIIAAVRTVGESISTFGDSAKYVVIKNLAFAPEDEFIVFDGFEDKGVKKHGKGREALRAQCGEIVLMDKLRARTYALLDVESMQFSDAVGNSSLSPADRLNVKHWLDKFESSLQGTVLAP